MNLDQDFGYLLTGMACITFICRYFFLSKNLPFELGPKAKSLLSYTAPSVLTAMWVPIVFLSGDEPQQTVWLSPFFIAGGVCILLSLKLQNTLMIVLLSLLVFFVIKA